MSAGLLDLLDACAEAKKLLGARLTAVCISGPTLESSVSAVALAQTELGHSRVVHRLARQIAQDEQADDRAAAKEADFLNPGAEGDLLSPFENWIDVVAALTTVDRALEIWLREVLVDSDDERIVRTLSRIVDEEEFHHEFAQGWVEVIAQQSDLADQLAVARNAAWTWYRAWEDELSHAANLAHEAGQLARPYEHISRDIEAACQPTSTVDV